jgi:hypothetical protein
MADAVDSKSTEGNLVRVRLSPRASFHSNGLLATSPARPDLLTLQEWGYSDVTPSINATDDEDRARMWRKASDGLKRSRDTRRMAKMSRGRAATARRRAQEVVERTETLLDRVKGSRDDGISVSRVSPGTRETKKHPT